jgi:hypothetical protein
MFADHPPVPEFVTALHAEIRTDPRSPAGRATPEADFEGIERTFGDCLTSWTGDL